MIRISLTYLDDETVKLRLEGKLIGCGVSELEKECVYYLSKKNKTIILDFSGVSFLEPEGVKMLRSIKSSKLRIENCPMFIKKLLEGLI